MDINTFTVVGPLVADPVVEQDDGYTLTRFTLAVRATAPDAARPDIQHIPVLFSSDSGKLPTRYLRKGTRVSVTGWLWDSPTGLTLKGEELILLAPSEAA